MARHLVRNTDYQIKTHIRSTWARLPSSKLEKVLVLVACFVQSSSAAVAALPRRVRIEGQHFVEAANSQTIVLAGNDA